jgi:hypothetical protein
VTVAPRELSFDGQQSGWDELGGANPAFVNCVVNSPGGVRSRPGIRAWSEWPASVPSTFPVVAMAIFGDALLYITDDGAGTRDVFAWRTGGVIALSASADQRIDGSLRPTIATTRSWAIITGGGRPQKVTTGLVSSRLGGNPPNAADISTITQYLVLVANDASGLFFWDIPGDGGIETWETDLDFREAEARPDPLVACADLARELWMFGTQTVQVFTPDENEAFAVGPAIEDGCLALHSVVKVDKNRMAWLANGRRILISDSGPPIDLGDQGMSEDFKGLVTVDDCWSFRCVMGNFDFLVWVFPTEGRTFAFEGKKGVWSEWRRWANGRWQAWSPTSYVFWEDKNIHLVGLADGSIAELSLDATSDNGDALRCVARMGFTAPPTDADTIQARETRMRMRSLSDAVMEGSIDVRWRDGVEKFRPALRRTFTRKRPTAVINPCGTPYQQRQYEFSWDAADAVYLAGVTEVLEELEV